MDFNKFLVHTQIKKKFKRRSRHAYIDQLQIFIYEHVQIKKGKFKEIKLK